MRESIADVLGQASGLFGSYNLQDALSGGMQAQHQAAQIALLEAMQQRRQPTPDEEVEYCRRMMNANPLILPGNGTDIHAWPPPVKEAPSVREYMRLASQTDWVWAGWLAAMAGLAMLVYLR